MNFFAFPLLLLVALSTICASTPVYIESRGSSTSTQATNTQATQDRELRARVKKKQSNELYMEFHGLSKDKDLGQMKEWIKPIQDWSIPDDVVEPLNHEGIIIKRVDLSTVTVPNSQLLANRRRKMKKAQKKQIFFEIENLEMVHLLDSWCRREEKSEDGKKKTVFYIGIIKPGVPSSESTLTAEQKTEARENGIRHYAKFYHISPGPEYNKNEYFGFSQVGIKPFATPIFWRYATRS